MIGIKRNGNIFAINPYILAVRCQHVKVASQCHITFRGWYVMSFSNLLPLTIANAIFTLKAHLSNHSTYCLIAIDTAKPQ